MRMTHTNIPRLSVGQRSKSSRPKLGKGLPALSSQKRTTVVTAVTAVKSSRRSSDQSKLRAYPTPKTGGSGLTPQQTSGNRYPMTSFIGANPPQREKQYCLSSGAKSVASFHPKMEEGTMQVLSLDQFISGDHDQCSNPRCR